MTCSHCNTLNQEGARFCKSCGANLSNRSATAVAGNMDVLMLTSYIAWHFLTYLLYAIINRVIIPKLMGNGTSTGISNLYKTLDWIIFGIDFSFLLILAIILKNNMAKIFCIVFLVIRIGLFIMYHLGR